MGTPPIHPIQQTVPSIPQETRSLLLNAISHVAEEALEDNKRKNTDFPRDHLYTLPFPDEITIRNQLCGNQR